MKRSAMVVTLLTLAQWMAVQAQTAETGDRRSPSFSPVTWERLVNAADEPENWLMYSGTLRQPAVQWARPNPQP